MRKMLQSIRKIMFPVFILTFMNMNSVMADRLCFYSPSQVKGGFSDANCPVIDAASGLYLSWVSDIDHFKGIPTKIRLDGNYKANSFLPSDRVLSYEALTSNSHNNSQSNNSTAQIGSLIEPENNILDQLHWSLYSIEGRVRLKQENGSISLSCQPGKAQAGLVFTLPYRSFPKAESYSVVIRGLADQPFKIAFADNTISLSKDAQSFPVHSSIANQHKAAYDLVRLSGSNAAGNKIIIECPQQAAYFNIAEMALVNDKANPSLATWVWYKQDWLLSPAKLLDQAKRYGIKKLYVQIEIKDNRIVDEQRLIQFITEAHKRSIDIYAVEGDAQMIRGRGQELAFQRTQCLAAFQKRLPAYSKLAGIQYDIEPYTEPKFADNPANMWVDWAATLIKMHDIWAGPIDIVVPYWMQNRDEGKDALFSVKELGTFTVMIYRTNETELHDLATQWLIWGEKTNIKISIAIENGPANGPAKMFFKPAFGSSPYNYSRPFILLVTNAESRIKKTIYELVSIEQPESENISFLARADELKRILSRLHPYFSAFSSFNGWSIHGLN